MTHHPHVHMIVPGGGISLDRTRWVRCKPGFLLPVQVLSRLFRRRFLTALADAPAAGRLAFFGEIDGLRRRKAFDPYLAPLKRKNWFVDTKPPFAGPQAVLAYLARYTHRVAISNPRLIALDERGVTFHYKDYRRNGPARYCTMTLSADEFIGRFLLHVLPKGFHRSSSTLIISITYNAIPQNRSNCFLKPTIATITRKEPGKPGSVGDPHARRRNRHVHGSIEQQALVPPGAPPGRFESLQHLIAAPVPEG